MQQTGNGLTFLKTDVQQAQRILGLLSAAKFELSAKQVLEAAQAIAWFRDLLPKIQENILELVAYKPGEEPVAENPE